MRKVLPAVTTVILSCLLAGPCVHSRGLTLAQLSYEYVPSAELDLTGIEDEELQTVARTFTNKFAVPILLNGTRTMLINFVTLRMLHQDYEDPENPTRAVFKPRYLYSIKYGLVFRRVLNEKWTFAALVQPVLLSDFHDIDRNHFRLRGGFLFEKRVDPSFKYALGIGFSDDYGDEKVLPVIQFRWTPNPNWTVNFDVPQKLQVWRYLHRRVDLGLMAKVTGAHFRIGENVRLSDSVVTNDGRVKYSILNAGPSLRIHLFHNIDFIANAGRSFFRRFEVFDDNDNRLEDSEFENSFFMKVFLKYNVSK